MSTDYFIDHDSIYSIGLLSATTSRFISSCIRAKSENESIILNDNDKILLENAKQFLLDILIGKNLQSPSADGIIAFNYALQGVPRESIGTQRPPTTIDELTKFFETIQFVLNKVSETNVQDITEDKINLTHRFFSKLADMFLDKVQTFARSESKIFQSI